MEGGADLLPTGAQPPRLPGVQALMKRPKHMRLSFARCLCVAGLLCLANSGSARAEAVGDYQVILERNPFGLKPPPPPPPPPAPAPDPVKPTNWKLSGLTALFKPPRAMFVNQVPGKPTPEYLSVPQGERQGAIEVLPDGIDIAAGTVRVKINGEERTMSFKDDGLKGPAGPPVPTLPSFPVPPGLNPTPATPLGGGQVPAPVVPTIPTVQPLKTGVQPAPATPAGVVPIPGASNFQRNVRIAPGVAGQNATSPPPAPNVDPAEQALRMEINRKITEAQVQRGELPPLPGTDLTPLTQPPPVPGR